jgi:hypothetical protein
MRTTGLRTLIIAGAVMAVSAIAAEPAGALDVPPKQVNTEVRFLEVNRDTFRDFHGRLDAPRFKECLADRDVTLFYKAMPTSTPVDLGTDETNAKGVFLIELDLTAAAGEYGVEVSRDRDKAERHGDVIKLICKPVLPVFTHF